MEILLAPEVIEKPKKLKLLIGVSVFCIVLIIVIVGAHVYPKPIDVPKALVAQFAGTLMLSYVPEGSTLPNLFSYDLAQKKVTPVPNTKGVHTYAESKQGDKAYGTENADGTFSVRLDRVGAQNTIAGREFIPPTLGTVGALAFNESGTKLVYEIKPYVTSASINDTKIVLVDIANQTQAILERGISPVFYNDDMLFFLKDDGVYSRALSTSEIKRIFYFEDYEADGHSRIVHASSKEDILITLPSLRRVVSLLLQKDGVSLWLAPHATMDQLVESPVLSPDGTHLAFIQDRSVDDSRNATLKIVDLKKDTVRDALIIEDKENAAEFVMLSQWK